MQTNSKLREKRGSGKQSVERDQDVVCGMEEWGGAEGSGGERKVGKKEVGSTFVRGWGC